MHSRRRRCAGVTRGLSADGDGISPGLNCGRRVNFSEKFTCSSTLQRTTGHGVSTRLDNHDSARHSDRRVTLFTELVTIESRVKQIRNTTAVQHDFHWHASTYYFAETVNVRYRLGLIVLQRIEGHAFARHGYVSRLSSFPFTTGSVYTNAIVQDCTNSLFPMFCTFQQPAPFPVPGPAWPFASLVHIVRAAFARRYRRRRRLGS